LAIAEGVETALSFYDLFRIPCWAALGTSNLQAFVPPPEVKHVFIAVDGDRSGYEAAAKLFSRLKGRVRCTLSAAPDGLDWSDVLIARRGGPDR
jgi:DNA primase